MSPSAPDKPARRVKPIHRRSLFLWLFLSILAITVIILMVQSIAVIGMFNRQSDEFEQDVFERFARRLQDTLDTGSRMGVTWDLSLVEPVLMNASDDRISGLILYDSEGNTVLTFGKTPKGVVLPSVTAQPAEPITVQITTSGESDYTPLPERSWFVSPTITKVYVNTGVTTGERGVVMARYPEPVREQDVVGRVMLYADAARTNVLGSVDVLAFSPMTYQLTALLLKRMLSTFSITIPIALVIALLGSHLISRWVSHNTKRVAQALKAISAGDYTNTVAHSPMREFAQISDSVQELAGKLKSHELMRQQWLRSIAHDLNTPVTALKLSIEGALDGVLHMDTRLLERLKKENDELERRVASVMMLSAMEAPDYTLKLESIELLEFVDEVVNSSLSQRKISLDMQLEHITADRRLLVIVCRELLKNADKYSPSEGLITWRIMPGIPPASVRMEVSNLGQVPQELLEHVFEPWFRADASRSRDGSGMGLSIVRQVMGLHHGTAGMEQRGDSIVVTLQW